MPEANKSHLSAPVSQKADPNAETSKQNTVKDNPKMESTGAVKSPSGQTVKASESVNKDGVITGDKTSKSTSESNEPFEKSFSSIEGEALQGDSFRIILQRGRKTIRIPVPITGSDNIVTITNVFKLIKEVLETPTEKELEEKFGSFVE